MLQQLQTENFECFKMEANELLLQMKNYHKNRRRQIERAFDLINDNMPEDLKTIPMSEILEKLLSVIRNKLHNFTQNLVNETDIVDESLYSADFSEGSDKEPASLTSTVKKLNPVKKNVFDKHKLENMINEHSMISEVVTELKPKDEYCVGIVYYLKDGTKVEKKLKELKSADVQEIHDNCLDDVKMISDLVVNVKKK